MFIDKNFTNCKKQGVFSSFLREKQFKMKHQILKNVKQRINIQKEIKASAIYTASNLSARALSLFMTPIFTRLLTPSEYSIYPLFLGLTGIFSTLITLEVSGGLIFSGLLKFKGKSEDGFIFSAFLSELLPAAVFSLIYIIFKRRINVALGLSGGLIPLLITQVLLNSAINIFISKIRFHGAHKRAALISGALGFLSTPISLIFIRLGFGGRSRVLALLLTTMFFALPILVSLLKKGIRSLKFAHFSFIYKKALPLLPHYISLALISSGGRIIISKFLGGEALGKYSAAHSVGLAVTVIFTALISALSPKVSALTERKENESLSRIFKLSYKSSAFLILIFFCAANEIYKFASPRQYYSANAVIYFSSLGALFNFVSNLAFFSIVNSGEEKKLTKNSILFAALALPSSILLTKSFGYIGTAISELGISFIRMLFTLSILKKNGKCFIKRGYYLVFSIIIFIISYAIYLFNSSPVSRIMLATAIILYLALDFQSYKALFFKSKADA
jgi:O-antigen/teichoic acid export membrane protein